ncbi:hypothetical protein CMUS01_05855 [Colletotrichum musicola]|uniref:Uncharacterized protein n=1 Tax=Colletotrichum musicola TaxID=2175873 RepID=A0A8H6KP80_9PEZI|nr:hypothetical protein CMUS01_05855 [Colletotrichum musicola]
MYSLFDAGLPLRRSRESGRCIATDGGLAALISGRVVARTAYRHGIGVLEMALYPFGGMYVSHPTTSLLVSSRKAAQAWWSSSSWARRGSWEKPPAAVEMRQCLLASSSRLAVERGRERRISCHRCIAYPLQGPHERFQAASSCVSMQCGHHGKSAEVGAITTWKKRLRQAPSYWQRHGVAWRIGVERFVPSTGRQRSRSRP